MRAVARRQKVCVISLKVAELCHADPYVCRSLLHELPSGCELVHGFCTEVTLRPAASNSHRRTARKPATRRWPPRSRRAATPRRAGEPVTDIHFGLHVGKVFYGNVGSRERLDYTVIGRAVHRSRR
jgi:hypothetical protein